MKWCFAKSEVAICRTDWSRAGEKEEEKGVGDFREAARAKLKAADLIMVIPRGGLGAAREDYKARSDW